ncbi:MAG: DUF4870 domain-containing protein [Planctomycetota bacterium]|jgi:uncharacterized Tic20 family protein
MAEKEETPEPAEKPKDDTPVEKDVSAEQSASETPPVQEASFEQPQTVQDSPGSKEVNKDARMWAMFCHLAALAGIVVPVIGCIVGPLIVWQIKKDEFPFVDEQGKGAVNFQISMLLYLLVSAILWIPLSFFCIGVFIPVAISIVDLIFLLIAAVKANDGEHYRYPLTIRFIK